jgi:ketosteroid isomerase-like protein
MTPDDVQSWLDAYVAAWRSYDPQAIADLFAENAVYAYNPWAEPIAGREAIVAAWLRNPDDPDSWDAEYRPVLVAGNQAIATGESRYKDHGTYANLWQLTFDDDGRCIEYVDWYIKEPSGGE